MTATAEVPVSFRIGLRPTGDPAEPVLDCRNRHRLGMARRRRHRARDHRRQRCCDRALPGPPSAGRVFPAHPFPRPGLPLHAALRHPALSARPCEPVSRYRALADHRCRRWPPHGIRKPHPVCRDDGAPGERPRIPPGLRAAAGDGDGAGCRGRPRRARLLPQPDQAHPQF